MGLGTVIGKIFTKGFGRKVGMYAYSGIFGTGQEVFTKSIRKSMFKNPSGSIFGGIKLQGFWKNMGQAVDDVVVNEEKLAVKNGGVLKNLWKQIRDIPHCFGSKVKAGVRKASSANGMKMKIFGKEITHHSKLLGGLKGFGRAFMKKMPLLMGLTWVIGYAPDVVAAFKHGGFWTGVGEIAKSAGKLLLDVGGFMVGTAFGGLVGGIVGSIAFGAIGNAIFGKGYKAKMAEAEQQQTAQNPQNPQTQQNAPSGQTQNPFDATGSTQQYQTYPVISWQPPPMPGEFGYSQYQQMPSMYDYQQYRVMPWTNYQQYQMTPGMYNYQQMPYQLYNPWNTFGLYGNAYA